jgi:hypothetical protein
MYAAALLVGKRGFLGHNLPLFLALPALVGLLARGTAGLWRRQAAPEGPGNQASREEASLADHFPELLYAACCCGGIWLAYALTSNNYSGMCCSIRWFVPMLAPSYFVLALALGQNPRLTWPFLVLSAWGALLAAIMWYVGPWTRNMVPLYRPARPGRAHVWELRRTGFYLRHRGANKSSLPGPDGGFGQQRSSDKR